MLVTEKGDLMARLNRTGPARVSPVIIVMGAAIVGLALRVCAQPAFFQGLGVLPGRTSSVPVAMSADGTVVVGISEIAPCRWTAATGTTPINGLGGYAAVGIASGDGSVWVGGGGEAIRWTEATGPVAQGVPNGWDASWGVAVSRSGQVMIGGLERTTNRQCVGQHGTFYLREHRAFVQSEPQGAMNILSPLGGFASSFARSVSGDGSAVAGFSSHEWCGGIGATEACVWIGANRRSLHPILDQTIATGVSDGGAVVVGGGTTTGFPAWGRAFRWTDAEGMVDIGVLLPGMHSMATAVSADGSTIGVRVYDGSYTAFIWDQTNGMRRLEVALSGLGVNVEGWTDLFPSILSADGRTIAGTGLSPLGRSEGWVGFLGEPVAMCYANCDGSTAEPVLNVNDFVCFISGFAAADPHADCDHNMSLNVNDFVCFQTAFAAGCP